jgi:hypothetical protein
LLTVAEKFIDGRRGTRDEAVRRLFVHHERRVDPSRCRLTAPRRIAEVSPDLVVRRRSSWRRVLVQAMELARINPES